MTKLLPILLMLAYGLIMYRFSVWRTNRQLSAQSKELNDPVLNVHLDALARALDLPRVRVYLYDIAPVNGLAAPDGRIFITRGFYEKYQSGDVTGQELTSVIAHELGHVALGHARRRMIDFAGQNALRALVMLLLPPFLRGIGPVLANLMAGLMAARLSQSDEFEADAYASALLIKAGIGTAPQISLFEKLEDLTGGKRGKTPAWLMSHPTTPSRITAIRDNDARWGLSGN